MHLVTIEEKVAFYLLTCGFSIKRTNIKEKKVLTHLSIKEKKALTHVS